jgi:hypothetical protein
VRGKEWNNVMPAHSFLTNDQLSSLLTYVRKNFGHSTDEIAAEDVAAKRAKTVTTK